MNPWGHCPTCYRRLAAGCECPPIARAVAPRRELADTAREALCLAVADCNRMIDTEPGEQFWVGRMSALLLALDLLTRDPEAQAQ